MAGVMMKLRPWAVPNFAALEQPVGKREDGLRPEVSIALSDLDQSALDGLVSEWLSEVYRKAGRLSCWRNEG